MGIETIAFAALTAFSAISGMSAANDQAKAVVREGETVAKNKALEVARTGATQRTSFLNSGLTLEGTPQDVFADTYGTGRADIEAIRSNYNSKSKNIIGQARTKAISDIAGSFAGFSGGGGMFDTAYEGVASGLNKAGYGMQAYDMLEAADNAGGAGNIRLFG